MATITTTQGDELIELLQVGNRHAETALGLLREILSVVQTSAVVHAAIQGELAAPRLAAEHIQVQQQTLLADSERERQRMAIAAAAQHADTCRRLPSLWASGIVGQGGVKEIADGELLDGERDR